MKKKYGLAFRPKKAKRIKVEFFDNIVSAAMTKAAYDKLGFKTRKLKMV